MLITFSTSARLIFLKFSTKSEFFFFILIILVCWSNVFVAIENELLTTFKSTALLFIKHDIFKLEIWRAFYNSMTLWFFLSVINFVFRNLFSNLDLFMIASCSSFFSMKGASFAWTHFLLIGACLLKIFFKGFQIFFWGTVLGVW